MICVPLVFHYFVQPVIQSMKLIDVQFIPYPQINEKCTSKASGQSKKIDKKISAVAQKIAVDQEQAVLNHSLRC